MLEIFTKSSDLHKKQTHSVLDNPNITNKLNKLNKLNKYKTKLKKYDSPKLPFNQNGGNDYYKKYKKYKYKYKLARIQHPTSNI